jgi:hypothetical protein
MPTKLAARRMAVPLVPPPPHAARQAVTLAPAHWEAAVRFQEHFEQFATRIEVDFYVCSGL